jgi:DNA-directed RNA polymerase subunit beta
VDFAKLASVMPMPNLLDVQLQSFEKLVERDQAPEEQWDFSLDRVFGEIFPITDVNENFSLEYVSSELGEPKYSVEECIERDMTYASPLKATLRLIVWEDLEDGERRPKDIIEKEVYLGDLPLLTELGTFVINGAERVVVSQLHRSPGVVFEENIHPNGSRLHSARIIPFRGSWVEFTIDINDICYVHIDKKKKFPATALLRAFGFGETKDIFELFYKSKAVSLKKAHFEANSEIEGSVLAEDIVDKETGEVLLELGSELDEDALKQLQRLARKRIKIFASETQSDRGQSQIVKRTVQKDPTSSEAEALYAIYSLLRPGDAPNVETARDALERVFFNPKRYDLGRVGRYKINQRLGVDVPRSTTVLTRDDFLAIFRYLVDLNEGRGFTDDIDHLGNRRVRTVGELIANQLSVGLSRMARLVRERMSINTDPERISIDDLVNARTVSAVIQAFFGSSQLSQFMDQTNPLGEMTHKRRVSALGPGGLSRERAGFEVRDVHYSHYGRLCPVETPEGPNIGLISSLTTHARVNELGFIETPYRKVIKGKVTGKIEWLSANEEEEARIAQANAPLSPDGTFRNEFVLCRERGDFPLLSPENIEYMDVDTDQLVSVAAALIPFLEHDDANRALMGSNMQRQAVPLLFTDAPLVGTGLEGKVATDSGAVITAKRGGEVIHVTADEIVIDTGVVGAKNADEPLARLAQFDRYRLKKFWRTNQDTAINQRPLVRAGEVVEEGRIIADGPSTHSGELALGQNLTVAFMPWFGYNFEDAIILSERLVKGDALTSIHIQELELHVRDTKRGMEEITREIPNVSEEALVDLDERGIVRIGARVKSGDILTGKITPKGETELSPEEKLLTAIFGEKAKDVKDSSLRIPPGMSGDVIDVKVFSRRIDDHLLEKEHGARIGELRQWEREETQRIADARDEELSELLHLQTVSLLLKRGTVEPLVSEGTKLTKTELEGLDLRKVDLQTLKVQNKEVSERIRRLADEAQRRIDAVKARTEDQIDKVFQPDELPPGVVQLVKVYIAEKRKIAVGDKMAGRHGNKGIIARIAPEEDMPFLPDGSPVDIVLNPLGVPSRMNVGQILETHLGWASGILGFESKTPVFQGASEDEIGLLLKVAGVRWARDSKRLKTAFPLENHEDIRTLLRAALVADSPKVRVGGQPRREVVRRLPEGRSDRREQADHFRARLGSSGVHVEGWDPTGRQDLAPGWQERQTFRLSCHCGQHLHAETRAPSG